jgi:activating signal cointegrator complex subunit 3
MIRYDEESKILASTDLGRVASHFYIKYETLINLFNEKLRMDLKEPDILSQCKEFSNIK